MNLAKRARAAIPILDWLPHYRRADLAPDLVAGLTGAAILVPQSMAYATIAGLPPIVGLYASVVPVLVYAVFGQARQLSVGPLATISIIAAAALAKLAPAGSAQYIAYAATLALLVGFVHIGLGVARLGFLLRFLSEPVITGFIAAVGVIIITTQLGPLFGYSVPSSSLPYQTVYDWAIRLDETSVATLAMSVAALTVMLALRGKPRLPGALALVIVASIATYAFDLDAHSIAVVGNVPGGLAGPEMPPFSWDAVRTLLPAAFAITFIGFLESIALARTYAREHHYEVRTNHELVALGLTNASAGLFQGMVVTGAVTRSSIIDAAGARTQLSGAVSAVVVTPFLLFWTDAFSYIPTAVLAAIVVVAVLGFVKIGEARRLWRVQRADFWLMMLAFGATMAFGLEIGVLVAVFASIALIVYRVTRPRIPELGREPNTRAFVELGRHPGVETFPGVVILRVETPLYFTNAESVEQRLRVLVASRPELRTIVLDAGGINHLDSTGDQMLRKVAGDFAERGIRMLLVDVAENVRDVMDASGFTALVGADAFLPTDADAVAHLEQLG
jgi:SulP family sulfate permease